MLYEIECQEFKHKKIRFKNGLNVVLGTNEGDNSIGKSSFLLIVDFVFGGNTYAHSKDIIENVGNHDINFTFKFDDEFFYFSRNVIDYKRIMICDEGYKAKQEISVEKFCQWLEQQYKMNIRNTTFRDIVSRYILVYGKNNANEKSPLQLYPNESMKDASYSLLKLFDYYRPIHELEKQAEKSKEELSVYKQAQKFNYVSKIKKGDYNKNQKEIKEINSELGKLVQNLENGLMDFDAEISEEAVEIKKLLSRTRRLRSGVKFRIDRLNESGEYKFSRPTNDFKDLLSFFPNVNLKKIEEIENFHKDISSIFKKEIRQEKKKLEKELKDYDDLINTYEKQLTNLIKNPKLSKSILTHHAELLRRLELLQKENESYENLNILNKNKKEDENRLGEMKRRQFEILSQKINFEMKRLNEIIYGKFSNAPILNFYEKSYSFYTPSDTGTGNAYKGLVIFDISVLNLTTLPIIVHDSIVLKQISDIAIEKILELYISNGKQVIIAIDKQNSYTSGSHEIFESNCILHLAPNGEELFGRSWSKQID